MTSKGDGLLRSNLPLGDTILRGASYFVTVQPLFGDDPKPADLDARK